MNIVANFSMKIYLVAIHFFATVNCNRLMFSSPTKRNAGPNLKVSTIRLDALCNQF